MQQSNLSREDSLVSAADLLQSALELLDLADASAQIGAHIDLALHQLRSELLDPVRKAPLVEISEARH